MLNIEQLQSVHPAYGRLAKEANFHYESYTGGEQYKAGKHLTAYLGEQNAPGDQYSKRIAATPLDNHVQTTVDIYRSFLFRELPRRQLGVLSSNPLTSAFLDDADLEGQTLNSFLKTANDYAMVLGSVWILVDKPSYKVQTQAEEIQLGIRPYVCMYTPQNVLDWQHERTITGKVVLTYVKVKEYENDHKITYTVWTPTLVEKYSAAKDDKGELDVISGYEVYDNPLGYVPFIQHVPLRSPTRGVGHSLVADVAGAQKFIYNLYSELEQTIRISGHPTLAKTANTDATAGAGGVVTMDENLDPGLKPYLLQPTSAGIDGILKTIEQACTAIQRMTHTSAIQATNGTPMSGVALQTERQLLNAKLSDLADTLRETEVAIWDLFMAWQDYIKPEEFDIMYPETFDIRDRHADIELILKAKSAGVNSVEYQRELDRQVIELMVEDTEVANDIIAQLENTFTPVTLEDESGNVRIASSEEEKTALNAIGYR